MRLIIECLPWHPPITTEIKLVVLKFANGNPSVDFRRPAETWQFHSKQPLKDEIHGCIVSSDTRQSTVSTTALGVLKDPSRCVHLVVSISSCTSASGRYGSKRECYASFFCCPDRGRSEPGKRDTCCWKSLCFWRAGRSHVSTEDAPEKFCRAARYLQAPRCWGTGTISGVGGACARLGGAQAEAGGGVLAPLRQWCLRPPPLRHICANTTPAAGADPMLHVSE